MDANSIIRKNEAYLAFAAESLATVVQYSEKVSVVHGSYHPETIEVHNTVLSMIQSIRKSDKESLIDAESMQKYLGTLNALTGGFSVPEGACGTFERLYQMLEDFDAVSAGFFKHGGDMSLA